MVSSVTRSQNFGFDRLTASAPRQGVQQGSSQTKGEKNGVRKDAETAPSPEVQRQIDQLRATDRKVKAHEQAHIAAGGDLIRGGANFSYETGPDKKRYAVAGDVSIDTSEAQTPEATIPKAQRIQEAALAPADPSAQDRQVASLASQMEMQARLEMAMQAAEERARADSEKASQAIGAYQAAGGLEFSGGFSAVA